MGKSGGSTQTTSTAPPAYAQPYHQQALSGASNIAGTPYQPYEGAQIAGFSPEQSAGLDATTQRALFGSQVGNSAQADATKTLMGGYLDPNTNSSLRGAIDYGQNNIMKQYGAQLGRNFGNSGVNQEVGESAGRLASGLYDQERNRMMSAQQNAPNLANMDYTDLQALLGVGDVRQGQQQQLLDLGRNEYANAQNQPNQNLQTLLGAVSGTGGYGSSTSPNPYQSSRTASAAGGALAGAGAGASIGAGYGGWGALIGGAAGAAGLLQ